MPIRPTTPRLLKKSMWMTIHLIGCIAKGSIKYSVEFGAIWPNNFELYVLAYKFCFWEFWFKLELSKTKLTCLWVQTYKPWKQHIKMDQSHFLFCHFFHWYYNQSSPNLVQNISGCGQKKKKKVILCIFDIPYSFVLAGQSFLECLSYLLNTLCYGNLMDA